MSVITRWKSPPQHPTGDGAEFRYQPLASAKTGIRLAKLQPGTGGKAISIHLVDSFVTGAARVPYDALSYVWGPNDRDKTVFCNAKRLRITKTLLEALTRFRHPHHEVTLWIDQLCICQDRVKERNAQVQMMGDIFRAARRVIVWLGDDYDDSRAGMQLAQQLLHIATHQPVPGLGPADLETHGLPKQGSRRWKALVLILKRPWFWRTWIVQEVVLNPDVDLVLGPSTMTWDELASIVALLEGPLPGVWDPHRAAVTALELPFSRINRIRLRHQQRIVAAASPAQSAPPDVEQTRENPDTTVHDDLDILDLLLMSRSLGATDPRDKIYALLGLGRYTIDPDYSMTPESVFTDFALSTIGQVTALLAARSALRAEASQHDRVVRRAMILLSCAGRQNQKLRLPSWVPDWTTDVQSRPLIFGMGQKFRAGGHRLGLFDWHPDSGLQLSAMLFDTIQTTGKTRLCHQGPEVSEVSHKLIEQWWREATEIAVKRTVRSPGSTTNVDAFAALRRSLSLCKHGYYIGEDPRAKRRGSLLDEDDAASDTSHSALRTLTLGPTRGRTLFVSATGHVGLAPHGVREGDLIFIVLGSDVPFVLRQNGEAYELLGEAYVQGIMDGEALEMASAFDVHEIMIR